MSASRPHHMRASRVTAKFDFLCIAARQYAEGAATEADLEIAALEYAAVFNEPTVESVRQERWAQLRAKKLGGKGT